MLTLEIGKAYKARDDRKIVLKEHRKSSRLFGGTDIDGRFFLFDESGTHICNNDLSLVTPWPVIEGPGPYKCGASKVDVLCRAPHDLTPGFDWIVQVTFCDVGRFSDDGKPQRDHIWMPIIGPWVEPPPKQYRPLTVVEAAQNFDRGVQLAKDEYKTGNRWELGAVDRHQRAEIHWKAGTGNSRTVDLSRLATHYVWSDTNEPCGIEQPTT